MLRSEEYLKMHVRYEDNTAEKCVSICYFSAVLIPGNAREEMVTLPVKFPLIRHAIEIVVIVVVDRVCERTGSVLRKYETENSRQKGSVYRRC